ncbi:MAG TPA: ABC transporter ATP-binding protein [Gaiellales bacterium]|nr:ABC transporter ATP-binding protein [Gaiellales bacterium]
MARSRRTGLSRLSRYLQGRWLVVTAMILVATGSAAAQSGGWLLVRAAIDDGISKHDDRTLTIVVVAYLALNAIGWICQVTLIRGLAGIGQGIVLGLRRDLFDHLTSLSLRYFSEQRAGWIIARLTSDVDAISDAFSQGLSTLVSNVVLLPTTVVVLFIVDWRLALVAMVILPPTIVVSRWFQRRSAVAQLDVRNRIAAVTAHVAESVSGMAIIQAFNRERAFQSQFDELNLENRRSNIYAQKLFSVFFPAIELFGAISTCAVLLVGTRFLGEGTLTIGTLITAIYLLQLVFQPLQELSDVYGQMQAAAAAMVKISSVLDTRADIEDRPDARPIGRIEGRIDLDGVRFSYGDNEVLHGIDIHVPAGGCIALVGQTGGGKSTLAKLIARFYDPSQGTVRMDGTDLREVELRSYRRQLGVVLQDPFLFSGTIADNIRFARPEATDQEVAETAAAIGVDRLAARLHGGLQHPVREGGAGLSAGERQLISIARALLADPRVLILDEATSNIDRPTEVLIERALDRLLRGRSSIIIAHRLATVRRADRILVIEHGRIVQQGTEGELLAVEGSFRRLARRMHTPSSAIRGRPSERPAGRRRSPRADAV